MNLGEEYHYDDIIYEAEKTDASGTADEVTELGPECNIGESVMTIKNPRTGKVRTFVMSRYNQSSGAYYRLVYDDYSLDIMLENPYR
jgi:hypothetical protein